MSVPGKCRQDCLFWKTTSGKVQDPMFGNILVGRIFGTEAMEPRSNLKEYMSSRATRDVLLLGDQHTHIIAGEGWEEVYFILL